MSDVHFGSSISAKLRIGHICELTLSKTRVYFKIGIQLKFFQVKLKVCDFYLFSSHIVISYSCSYITVCCKGKVKMNYFDNLSHIVYQRIRYRENERKRLNLSSEF